MSRRHLEDLTSAEAGFFYAAYRAKRLDMAGEKVDDVVALPLRKAIDGIDTDKAADELEILVDARLEKWSGRRGEAEKSPQLNRLLQVSKSEKSTPAQRHFVRQGLRRIVDQKGADLSRRSPHHLDLRHWITPGSGQPLVARLIILGGVLIGTLGRTSIRRRLAAMFRDLPASVGEEIKMGLAASPEIPPAVIRRIYEVYGRISRQGLRADQELARLGLFFVISAETFRQAGLLDRLREVLPDGLAGQCKVYRDACIHSRKPELAMPIAETIVAISGNGTGESDGGDDG